MFQPVWFTFEADHNLKEKIRKCEWENPEYSYMVVMSSFRKYLLVVIFNFTVFMQIHDHILYNKSVISLTMAPLGRNI